MTPLQFTKGLADSGSWGDKYFGRIMTETVHIGEGCAHKTTRVRVIYGLDPIFESGTACIMKVQNPIAYGTKQESNLAERNGEITKQVSIHCLIISDTFLLEFQWFHSKDCVKIFVFPGM